MHLQENPNFPLTLKTLKHLWSAPFQGLYIPLTYTFWGLASRASQAFFHTPFHPALFHGLNVVFHSLNGVWVILILGVLGFSDLASMGGALLFALHPVQAEPVSWISGFKDVGSSFFALMSIYLFLRFLKTPRKSFYLFSIFSFGLGMLCKPSVIVVLPVLATLIFWKNEQPSSKIPGALKHLGFFILLCLPVLWFTPRTQPPGSMIYVPPIWERPLVAADSIVFYCSKLIFPVGLIPEYSRSPRALLQHPWAWIALGTFFLGLCLFYRRNRATKTSLLLFLSALLPVLGLIPFYFQFFSSVADRYLYLALLGPAFGLAYFLDRHPRALPALSLMLGLGILSFHQSSYWKSNEVLFSHLVKTNPRSLLGQNNFGNILEQSGNDREAAAHYYEALKLDPTSMPAKYNLARVLGRLGYYDPSIQLLQELVHQAPGLSEAHYTLGFVLLQKHDYKNAQSHLSYATKLSPNNSRAFYQLGHSLLAQRQFDQAKDAFQKALEINPDYPAAKLALAQAISMAQEHQSSKSASIHN